MTMVKKLAFRSENDEVFTDGYDVIVSIPAEDSDQITYEGVGFTIIKSEPFDNVEEE
jgi:hypothetical protein